jgi:hypothetical protein
MRITTYHAKATRTIPVKVEYCCEFCNQPNTDNSQKLVVSAASHGSLINHVTDEMKEEAAQITDYQTEKLFEDLKNRRYIKAGFTCTCKRCGKKQTWSSFCKYYSLLIMLFILGIIFFICELASVGSLYEENPAGLLVLLLPVAMALPHAILLIRNLIKNSHIKKLDEKYLPKIFIGKHQVPEAPVPEEQNQSTETPDYGDDF